MSTAAAAEGAAPPKGKKKLFIIIGAVLALVLAGGGAMVMLKKPPPEDSEEADGEHAAPQQVAVAHDPKTAPTFVPLDPFTVNLADREAERYAQVGITLEVGDPKIGEQIKVYMPAIRNNILLALAEKTAGQLMDREGKTALAEQVRRETSRAMGYEVEDPEEEDEDEPPRKKKKKKRAPPPLPIAAVHFSNFIIQ